MIKRNGDNVFAIASSNNQCGARGSSVSLCPAGVATKIPRATAARMTPPDAQQNQNTKETNIALSTYVEKWKNRYEDAERKHKTYLLKTEKAKREYDDLQRRHNIVLEERNHLDAELRERERELAKLRTVSEKLCREYQQLRNQQEVDSGVMHKVMQQAGEWYKQNKQLKRRSSALLQALPARARDVDFTDSNDAASDTSSNEEVEFLKATVLELSEQVAALQTELGAVKLQEFEAQENNVALAQELEALQAKYTGQESELSEARRQLERHHRVSKLMMDDLTQLKENADNDRIMAETYKTEARAAKVRVKQLTHQSALLLSELEPESRLLAVLQELGQLRDRLLLQDERTRDQLEDLQLKLAEKHEETDILLWEEKIRLAEEDSQKALERAEKAEKKLAEIERKFTENERKLTEAEKKLTKSDQKLTETEIKLLESQRKVESKPSKRSNLMSRISYFENAGGDKKETKEVEGIVEQAEEEVVDPQPPTVSPLSPSTSPKPPSPPQTPSNPIIPPPPCPPVMPPPPPPPPPPPATFTPHNADDMASMLANRQGTLKRTKQNGEAPGGAIDAIVDQIKGGKFQLRATEQSFLERRPAAAPPPVVSEMLAVLGTLRRRRHGGRPAQDPW